jgi:aldehyde dehydrogenase (NAD+)
MIVAPTADLELAERAITFAAVGTAGQRCTTLAPLVRASRTVRPARARGCTRSSPTCGRQSAGGATRSSGPLIDGAAFDGMQAALHQARAEAAA